MCCAAHRRARESRRRRALGRDDDYDTEAALDQTAQSARELIVLPAATARDVRDRGQRLVERACPGEYIQQPARSLSAAMRENLLTFRVQVDDQGQKTKTLVAAEEKRHRGRDTTATVQTHDVQRRGLLADVHSVPARL